jgi:hypothetical protein
VVVVVEGEEKKRFGATHTQYAQSGGVWCGCVCAELKPMTSLKDNFELNGVRFHGRCACVLRELGNVCGSSFKLATVYKKESNSFV